MSGLSHGSWQIGKVFGIPIRVHYTWLIIFGLLTWSLSTLYFPSVAPQMSQSSYWIKGALAALLLFVSVAIHELSHSLVALKYRLEIESITLFIFGGVAQMKGEPPSPQAEFRIAIAGPLASFALAGIFYALEANTLDIGAKSLFAYVSNINLILGIFNLIPGFPMDGGRVFRAMLWSRKKDYVYATQKASKLGQGIAVFFIIFGLFLLLFGAPTGLWLILIGWFLYSAAYGSYQQTTLQALLEGVKVKDIMARELITVEPQMNIQELVNKYFLKYGYTGFPVTEGGKYLGIITLRDIKNIPEADRAQREVSEFYQRHRNEWEISEEEFVVNALERMLKNEMGRLVVVDGDKIVGMITRNGIAKYLEVKGAIVSKEETR
ncbi:site-2 protease family protein [Thermodesulfovibrio sp.]|uniref:site-2 protease family protein n=1 Tax=Thermodesulfovibrio TaxID=28261 RepID=UPI0026022BD9|nr:site-2 protease family protein [Thermodesulfovibrio sp.]